MTASRPRNLPDPALEARLERAFPGVAITLGAKLAHRKNRKVFEARLNEAQCLVKFLDDPDARTVISTAEAEIASLEKKVNPGRFSVNRCLMTSPENGLIVLSWVAGERLDMKIAASRGAERAALFRQAGACLDWIASGRSRTASFAPRAWMDRMRARELRKPTQQDDTRLLARLVRTCQAHARHCRGKPVRRAICHGDFVGANVLWDAGQMTVVDIQGQAVLAVARDAARFLVWQAMRDPAGQSLNDLGLPTDDCAAFLASGVLPAEDRTTAFPFFVGEQLHGRFHDSVDRPEMLDTLRKSIVRFCNRSLPE